MAVRIHGETVRGGRSLTYIDQIRRDTGPGSKAEIYFCPCMEDRLDDILEVYSPF